MKVSNSQIQTFKRCRRLWELQYKYELQPTTIAPALETGTTYHDKVEQILKTGTFQMDDDVKTNAMAIAFQKYILPHVVVADKFEPEVWFEHQTAGGNQLVGRYDGIGGDYLLEHKTTSSKVDGEYWQALELDEQILTYMLTSGKNKVLYTVCQKPTIRQTTKETVEQFQQRCIDWYDVDTDSKIACQLIVRNADEIAAFEREIDAMCAEIESCTNCYRNTCHCTRWGRMCEFMPICKHYDPQESYVGFERREQR